MGIKVSLALRLLRRERHRFQVICERAKRRSDSRLRQTTHAPRVINQAAKS
jgi:hypothetical protein